MSRYCIYEDSLIHVHIILGYLSVNCVLLAKYTMYISVMLQFDVFNKSLGQNLYKEYIAKIALFSDIHSGRHETYKITCRGRFGPESK